MEAYVKSGPRVVDDRYEVATPKTPKPLGRFFKILNLIYNSAPDKSALANDTRLIAETDEEHAPQAKKCEVDAGWLPAARAQNERTGFGRLTVAKRPSFFT